MHEYTGKTSRRRGTMSGVLFVLAFLLLPGMAGSGCGRPSPDESARASRDDATSQAERQTPTPPAPTPAQPADDDDGDDDIVNADAVDADGAPAAGATDATADADVDAHDVADDAAAVTDGADTDADTHPDPDPDTVADTHSDIADAADGDADVPTQQPVGRAGQEVSLDDLPWPIRLGMRVEMVNQAFRLVDRVVLVPDTATLVDEVSKWSLGGARWPVLIEDDFLAPMFIRSFKPAEVVRRPSVGLLANARQERQQAIVQAIARVWGAEASSNDELSSVYQARGHVPAGLVVTSVDDSAWPAAFILAAGRGQMIAWMDRGYNRPNQIANEAMTDRFLDEVHALLELSGYDFDQLGDAIETITICRDVAGRMRSDVHQDPTAMTDLLGRSEPTERYAFGGWIFGDETHATYMAMCSLFLDRQRFWLANTYRRAGNFGNYAFDDAAPMLDEAGFTVRAALNAEALIESRWMALLSGGLSADVILMNSKGNADFFDVGNDDRLRPFDVPILNEPAALQLVHSWAFRSPQQENSVGGQWLNRGVYAAVGSVHEPFLAAFLPPDVVVDRLTKYVPFLVACRHWTGRQWIHRPWKVNTIGDPLMLCRPVPLERNAPPNDGSESLHDQARALLEQVREEPTEELFVALLEILNLLGRDELMLNVWRLAQQHDLDTEVAGRVLPSAFRMRDTDIFMQAYRLVPQPTQHEKIMLWHLMYPRMGPAPDAELVGEFARSLRTGGEVWDLQRIHEHIRRAMGPAHLRLLVERALETTTNQQSIRILERMLR